MQEPSKYFQISSYLSLVKWNWNSVVNWDGISKLSVMVNIPKHIINIGQVSFFIF